MMLRFGSAGRGSELLPGTAAEGHQEPSRVRGPQEVAWPPAATKPKAVPAVPRTQPCTGSHGEPIAQRCCAAPSCILRSSCCIAGAPQAACPILAELTAFLVLFRELSAHTRARMEAASQQLRLK